MIILPPTLTRRTRQELAEFVVDGIEALGIPVPPGSRYRRMRDLLVAANGVIPRDHPEIELAFEAERDLQLLGLVLHQFGDHPPPGRFRQLLHDAVSDSVLPQQDRELSPGRDAAFELFVGAVCHSAGLAPVTWDEPDVTCVWNGVTYGLAAKRIKSARKLEKNIRDARKQIGRASLPGIIVLDTSLAFNPNNARIEAAIPDDVFGARYGGIVRRLWSRKQRQIQGLFRDLDVRGVILHDHQVRFQTNGEWGLAGMTLTIPALARTHREQRAFDAFATLYTHGMPEQNDLPAGF
jgi:hypothetical protein